MNTLRLALAAAFLDPKAKEARAGTSTDDATSKHLDQGLVSQPPNQMPDPAWWDRHFSGEFWESYKQAFSSEKTKIMPSTQRTINPIVYPSIEPDSSQPSVQELEDRLYEQIAQELESNTVDKGVWTKVYAQAGGDDKQTRALYIQTRFDRLMAIENTRMENARLEAEANKMKPLLER